MRKLLASSYSGQDGIRMTLPTLEEIEREAGFALFNLWKQNAEHKSSFYEHAEQRHAFEYGFIIRAYLELKETDRKTTKGLFT